MKKCRILADYATNLEEEVNELLADGYEIHTVLQQSDNGTHICIIMLKEEN